LTAQFWVLPAALWVLEESLLTRQRGVAAAQAVAITAGRLEDSAASRGRWDALAVTFRGYGNDHEADTYAADVNRLGREHQGVVQIAGYLLLSAHPQTDFAKSALLQAEAAAFALQLLAVAAQGSAQRFAYLVSSLWSQRADAARFRFRAPSFLIGELQAAANLAEPEQVTKSVLKAVVTALSVRLSDSARTWLNSPSAGASRSGPQTP
jgi:hypothetical protein